MDELYRTIVLYCIFPRRSCAALKLQEEGKSHIDIVTCIETNGASRELLAHIFVGVIESLND